MDHASIRDALNQAIQARHHGQLRKAMPVLLQLARSSAAVGLEVSLELGKLLLQCGPPGYAEAEGVLTAARQQAEAEGTPQQAATAVHLLALLRYSRHQPGPAVSLLEATAPSADSGCITGAFLGTPALA
jgi:hypothetical protein